MSRQAVEVGKVWLLRPTLVPGPAKVTVEKMQAKNPGLPSWVRVSISASHDTTWFDVETNAVGGFVDALLLAAKEL